MNGTPAAEEVAAISLAVFFFPPVFFYGLKGNFLVKLVLRGPWHFTKTRFRDVFYIPYANPHPFFLCGQLLVRRH